MDFVSDALFDGRRLRLLTVIDLYTRECLGICVGQNLRSTEVAEMLNSIALRRPLPQLLKTDNGSEFAGKMLDRWYMNEGSGSTSHGREHRRIMRRWGPSTAV
jgi:putative transposase